MAARTYISAGFTRSLTPAPPAVDVEARNQSPAEGRGTARWNSKLSSQDSSVSTLTMGQLRKQR